MRFGRSAPYAQSLSFGIILIILSAGPARPTPFFARQYGLKCGSCHAGVPRLNEFGLMFKSNNFRMPDAERVVLAWQKTVPLAVQIQRVSVRTNPGSADSAFTDSQLLSGGLLSRKT